MRVFSEVGLRTVWLGGKKDMGSYQQLDLVIRHWQALEDRREELGPGLRSVTLLGGGAPAGLETRSLITSRSGDARPGICAPT
jgi:hypothetical protein